MKVVFFILLFISTPLLAYEQPKVEDPNTTLSKLNHLISFKDTNVSLRGLNTVQMTKNLLTVDQFQFQNYGWINASNKQYQDTLQISWRFR